MKKRVLLSAPMTMTAWSAKGSRSVSSDASSVANFSCAALAYARMSCRIFGCLASTMVKASGRMASDSDACTAEAVPWCVHGTHSADSATHCPRVSATLSASTGASTSIPRASPEQPRFGAFVYAMLPSVKMCAHSALELMMNNSSPGPQYRILTACTQMSEVTFEVSPSQARKTGPESSHEAHMSVRSSPRSVGDSNSRASTCSSRRRWLTLIASRMCWSMRFARLGVTEFSRKNRRKVAMVATFSCLIICCCTSHDDRLETNMEAITKPTMRQLTVKARSMELVGVMDIEPKTVLLTA
mmetsp:Transcript_93841/g.287119  ORF Transcript_93841/g.287119 Transcript_93841/m.287119 type:complete len:300 (+) Transcript_93841:2398-3297(+)